MIKPESETANKVEHLKARIHEAVSSSDPGIVIFAVIIAAQLIVGTLGLALDRLYGAHHGHHGNSLATELPKR
ncbi:MAG: hypothetical protein WCD69_26040 [Xanthobacteraceae bacterium]|jgi:hypothetical protein